MEKDEAKKTQKDRVKEWLMSGRELTPQDAYFHRMGMRLGAIIHGLRHDEGWDIIYLNEKGEDRYARYKLVPKNLDLFNQVK